MEGPTFVLQQRGQTGRSKLHQSAYKGDLQEVIRLLQEGIHPDTPSRLPSDNGRQALHLAVLGEHLDVVNELLNRGADPDAADLQGFRPLHVAAQKGAVSIVQRLHAAKANLKTQTKAGWQAVHLAASNGHVPVLRQLQDYHCNLAAPDFSLATPLHHAAGCGHHDVVRWLIKAGVSLEVRDENGLSAAERAKQSKHQAIHMDLTEAAKINDSKYRTGRRQRFQPDILPMQQMSTSKSPILRKFPSSPNLPTSFINTSSGHNIPVPCSTSTALPDILEFSTTRPLHTAGLKSKAHNLPSDEVLVPLKCSPTLRQPQISSPQQEKSLKTLATYPQQEKSSPTQHSPPKSPPQQRLLLMSPPRKCLPLKSPIQDLQPKSPPAEHPPNIPAAQLKIPESPRALCPTPEPPPTQDLPPKTPPTKRQLPQFSEPQQLPLESPPVQSQAPKSPKSSSQQQLLLQTSPTKDLPTDSLLSQGLPSESPQVESLPPTPPPQENLPPESHITQRLPTEYPSDSKKAGEDVHTSTVIEDMQPSLAYTSNSVAPSVDNNHSINTKFHNRTLSSSSSDTLVSSPVRSTSPNVIHSRPPLISGEQGKPKKKEKKAPNLRFRRFFRSKSDPKVRVSDVNWNPEHINEEIARDGSCLGHGKPNHDGEPPSQKEAAFLDLSVQEAVRPFHEGIDVYPCTTNPRGIVIILNNKSFQGRPESTRYGAECDTKNLEDVFDKMGYDVRTRSDLTRQDTLDLFLEVSRLPMLNSVSCLFVFILSHGQGAKTFSTYDNKAVSLDEVQSYFLNGECPALRGKPKIFFSHFCRGDDEETQSQYSSDAQREAYKDMMCLYSSTEGFQALRNHRLGTPSVRALCLTMARYAHIKHFRDIVTKFQEQYEQLEGSTSPEVQDFKFKKYFYLNPTGKSRLS